MCSKHPKYEAKKKPLSLCIECWQEYVSKNKHTVYTNKDISRLILSMYKEIRNIDDKITTRIDHHADDVRSHGFIDPATR